MGISGSAGQRSPLPPSPRRFRSQRARLWGGKGAGVRAGLDMAPLSRDQTPSKGNLDASTTPDQCHSQLRREQGTVWDTVPVPHIWLLLQVNIWHGNKHKIVGKAILSGSYFFFACKQPCPRAITHHLLQCHPHFPAEREKRGMLEEGRAAARSQQHVIMDS